MHEIDTVEINYTEVRELVQKLSEARYIIKCCIEKDHWTSDGPLEAFYLMHEVMNELDYRAFSAASERDQSIWNTGIDPYRIKS